MFGNIYMHTHMYLHDNYRKETMNLKENKCVWGCDTCEGLEGKKGRGNYAITL